MLLGSPGTRANGAMLPETWLEYFGVWNLPARSLGSPGRRPDGSCCCSTRPLSDRTRWTCWGRCCVWTKVVAVVRIVGWLRAGGYVVVVVVVVEVEEIFVVVEVVVVWGRELVALNLERRNRLHRRLPEQAELPMRPVRSENSIYVEIFHFV